MLSAEPVFEWLDRHFLRHDPLAFQSDDFSEFALNVSKHLEVDPNGVFCIGSGAVGLSLNPKKASGGSLKKFDSDSDLDIAVISELHFETGWRALRARAHPVLDEMDAELRDAVNHQRKRFFDGALLINKLLPEMPYGAQWFRGIELMKADVAERFGREVPVNIWVYRDYWSVRAYVAEGLFKCKGAVQ